MGIFGSRDGQQGAGASVHYEAAAPDSEQGEYRVVNGRSAGHEDNRVPVVGRQEHRFHKIARCLKLAYLNLVERFRRVTGIDMPDKATHALVADGGLRLIPLADLKESDSQALACHPRIYNQNECAAFGWDKRTCDLHAGHPFVIVTESRSGTGLPNEIRWTGEAKASEKADYAPLSGRKAIVHRDGDGDGDIISIKPAIQQVAAAPLAAAQAGDRGFVTDSATFNAKTFPAIVKRATETTLTVKFGPQDAAGEFIRRKTMFAVFSRATGSPMQGPKRGLYFSLNSES